MARKPSEKREKELRFEDVWHERERPRWGDFVFGAGDVQFAGHATAMRRSLFVRRESEIYVDFDMYW